MSSLVSSPLTAERGAPAGARRGRPVPRAAEGIVLPSSLARALARRWTPVGYPEGQTLYYEGHASYGAYLVVAGAVAFQSEPGCIPATAVRPGTLLGAREILTGRTLGATAIVSGGIARVCFVDKTTFLSLLARQDRLIQAVMRVLMTDSSARTPGRPKP